HRGGRLLRRHPRGGATTGAARRCPPQVREQGPGGGDALLECGPRARVRLARSKPAPWGGGGETVKLAGHLAEAGSVPSSTTHRGKLFLFDEPTTGLHFEDVAKLLKAFRKLLAAGHSLLVIEHNLDVIGAADWIIDLGPE